MLKNKLIIATAVFILVAIPITVYVVSTQRDQRSRAAETLLTNSTEANEPPVVKEVWDLNNDGLVNSFDLSLVADKWGDKTKPVEDINQDGNVDVQDLSLITKHWH